MEFAHLVLQNPIIRSRHNLFAAATTRCAKGRHKPNISRCMPGAGLSRSCVGRCCPTCQPSSRIGENPPCGMIGRVEETSASFEARSAPRLYPTERLGVQFPGPTRPKCGYSSVLFTAGLGTGADSRLVDLG